MKKGEGACLVCGKPLIYFQSPQKLVCIRCGNTFKARCSCEDGHYICDKCHLEQGVDRCLDFCLSCESKNPIEILEAMMADPYVHMHGPEHHVLVGVALLTAVHNAGADTDLKSTLLQMRTRGREYPGGSCGFWGCCGAAVSAGMYMSILTQATPLSKESWGWSNAVTARCLEQIAALGGPRCCKRNSYTAILAAAQYTREILGIELPLPDKVHCSYFPENRECKGMSCPYFPGKRN